MDWLFWWLAPEIAEVVPTAPGGHPDRCLHWPWPKCRCETCKHNMRTCHRKTCRNRLEREAKPKRRKLKGHG